MLQLSCRLGLLAAVALLPVSGSLAGPVDINSADAATLAKELKGIGASKAAAIVDYRRTHGAFRTLDDLALVRGISQKLIERNRADLRLGRVAPTVAPAAPGPRGGTAVPPPAAPSGALRR